LVVFRDIDFRSVAWSVSIYNFATAGVRIPLDQIATPLDVKPRVAPIPTQVIDNIARNFFPKFADYFSQFAILELYANSSAKLRIESSGAASASSAQPTVLSAEITK
jgi:hypothetical protein